MTYREQHAGDGSAYIERLARGRWLLVFNRAEQSFWLTRESARFHVRKLKKGH